MKKTLFVLLVVAFAIVNLNAQTNVSGIISANTTWALANSPYIVTGNVLVNNGATLTIESGVVVKFEPQKALQINGQLIARGNSSSYVTFTSNKSVPAVGDWGYIFFNDLSTDATFDANWNYTGGSIMESCIVEYAGYGAINNGAIEMNNAHPYILKCVIRYNNRTGIYAGGLTAALQIHGNNIYSNTGYNSINDINGGGGIFTSGGAVTIANNTIRYNSVKGLISCGGGIFITSGTPYIANNNISSNISEAMGGGIFVYRCSNATISHNIITGNTSQMSGGAGGIYTLSGTESISDNFIFNNQGGGILLQGDDATVSNNCIIGNIGGASGGGIFISGATSTIINNIISDNSLKSDLKDNMGGAGIYVYRGGAGKKVNITKNSIVRNNSNYAPALNYPPSDNIGKHFDSLKVASNTITGNKATNSTAGTYTIRLTYSPKLNFNNIFNNTANFELFNGDGNTAPNLNATENWWGTSSDTKIQTKMHDWFDDASLGIINYSKYLTAPNALAPISPPTNVIKTNLGGGKFRLTWNRNPEADIAGYNLYYGNFTGYSFANMVNVGNDTTYTLSNVSNDDIAVTAYDKTYNVANELSTTIVKDNMTNGNESWYAHAGEMTGTGWTTQTYYPVTPLGWVKAVNKSVVWAAGDNGKVIWTNNGGSTWGTSSGSVFSQDYISAIDALDDNTAFVATSTSSGSALLYRTKNRGDSWTQVFSQPNGFINAIKMFDSNNGIAIGDPVGGKWTIIKTTNAGATWARLTTEPAQVGSETGYVNSLATLGTANIWFGTNSSKIYRSTDGGSTWSSSALPFVNCLGIAFSDSQNGFAGGDSGGLVQTTNGGSSWTSLTKLNTGNMFGMSAIQNNLICASRNTVYRSTDKGATWGTSLFNPALLNSLSFVANGSTLLGWAVDVNGNINAFSNTLTDIEMNQQEIPSGYNLQQNYPNPFNPTTKIRFDLPERSIVKLVVYDILGREVSILLNQELGAGNHEVSFNGINLSSGVYFYQIQCNSFLQTKKFILMK